MAAEGTVTELTEEQKKATRPCRRCGVEVSVFAGHDCQALASRPALQQHLKSFDRDWCSLLQREPTHWHHFWISRDGTTHAIASMELGHLCRAMVSVEQGRVKVPTLVKHRMISELKDKELYGKHAFECRTRTAEGRPCRNWVPENGARCDVHKPVPTSAPRENLLALFEETLKVGARVRVTHLKSGKTLLYERESDGAWFDAVMLHECKTIELVDMALIKYAHVQIVRTEPPQRALDEAVEADPTDEVIVHGKPVPCGPKVVVEHEGWELSAEEKAKLRSPW